MAGCLPPMRDTHSKKGLINATRGRYPWLTKKKGKKNLNF